MAITITPLAAQKIKEAMQTKNPSALGLKIGVKGGGCSGLSFCRA